MSTRCPGAMFCDADQRLHFGHSRGLRGTGVGAVREHEADQHHVALQHVGIKRDLPTVLRNERAIAEEQSRRLIDRRRHGRRSRPRLVPGGRIVRCGHRGAPRVVRLVRAVRLAGALRKVQAPRILRHPATSPGLPDPVSRASRDQPAAFAVECLSRWRASAHAACSRTTGDGSSARLRRAATMDASDAALPSATAMLRDHRS